MSTAKLTNEKLKNLPFSLPVVPLSSIHSVVVVHSILMYVFLSPYLFRHLTHLERTNERLKNVDTAHIEVSA